MEGKYCQSCSMPMGDTNELYGANADGSKSGDYCQYCFQNGKFTSNVRMEEMIDVCVPHMLAANPRMTEVEARKIMHECFPKLKRWEKA